MGGLGETAGLLGPLIEPTADHFAQLGLEFLLELIPGGVAIDGSLERALSLVFGPLIEKGIEFSALVADLLDPGIVEVVYSNLVGSSAMSFNLFLRLGLHKVQSGMEKVCTILE